MPDAFGVEVINGEPVAKPVRIEETVIRQIDRINYLRSTGQPWGEALEVLRDMVVGLEDDEFDDQWERRSIRAVKGPDGLPLFLPTVQDMRRSLTIIMALLTRRRITWRRQIISKTKGIGLEDFTNATKEQQDANERGNRTRRGISGDDAPGLVI